MTAWKGIFTELAQDAVSLWKPRESRQRPLAFVPFSASARGSDRKPVLTFRYGWAKVIRKIQGQQADGVICLR